MVVECIISSTNRPAVGWLISNEVGRVSRFYSRYRALKAVTVSRTISVGVRGEELAYKT